MARHRDGCQKVAAFPHKPPEACAFGAEDDRGRNSEVDRVIRRRSFTGQTDGPNAGGLQVLERPGDVDDLGDPDMGKGAGGCLGGRTSERRRAAALDDDSVDAGGIRGPQDGAKVLGIFNAVENDDQRDMRIAYEIVDAVVLQALDVRSDTLMDALPGLPIENLSGDLANAHTVFAREGQKLTGAIAFLTAETSRHTNARDASGAKRFEHRVNPVDDHSA